MVAAFGARVVSADLKEVALQLGRELEPVSDVLGTTKTVFINGTAMHVSTAVTDKSPKEVLDRFESLCDAHPEFLARAFSDIPETLRAQVFAAKPGLAGLHIGAMRSERNGDGALACFMDDRPSSAADLPARLKAFAESWDLSEFGRFRYVYVNGQTPGKTRVRTIWADGAIKLKEMFPPKGDAAGFDSPVLPRPVGSRRIFSATAAEVPFGVHIYETEQSKADLIEYYDGQMSSIGWSRVESKKPDADYVTYFADLGHAVYVAFAQRGTSTLVTTVETARPGEATEGVVQLQ